MALLTRLSFDQVDALLEPFGLAPARNLEPVPKGSVNSNYFVDTDRGRFFLRVYEEQGPEGAGYETRLVGHLAAAGVPTPAPWRNPAGASFVLHAGKPVALFPAVSGDELCQARVTPEVAFAVGEALARVHLAGASFGERRTGRFEAADLRARLDTVAAAHLREPGVLERLHAELARPLPPLAIGPIHGDLFRDNVLWQDGRIVGLLDFESAADGLHAYDVAVTLLAWTYGSRFEAPLVRGLLAGYERLRPLTAAERAALPRLAERAACRFVVTRITDFHLRTLRDPGTVMLKDYRRFVRRWDAIASELVPALGLV
jgi:homoserine kinase type II